VPENIKSLQASVIARIKVMSKLDIAEKRLPQDGRINFEGRGPAIDVRVACIPSVEGESISLRLLGQERFTLNRLGLSEEHRPVASKTAREAERHRAGHRPDRFGQIDHALHLPHAAQQRAPPHRHHRRSGGKQDARHRADRREAEIGLTFASGLRSILRGDPNVVMIGEIRDLETAEIAVRASLTGHLVFSARCTRMTPSAASRV
jgi:general secretion pathway protein E